MAVRMLLSATEILQVYGSERKWLCAFTGKFPSLAAGLHLVLKTSCLRKKSRLVRYRWSNVFMQ